MNDSQRQRLIEICRHLAALAKSDPELTKSLWSGKLAAKNKIKRGLTPKEDKENVDRGKAAIAAAVATLDPKKPAAQPVPAKPPVKKEEQVCMPKKAFVAEHKKLVGRLRDKDPKALDSERREQAEELREEVKKQVTMPAMPMAGAGAADSTIAMGPN